MTFEKRKTPLQLEQEVSKNWALWRLVVSDRGFDYQTVFGKPFMTPQDVEMANIALNMQYQAEKDAVNKKGTS